MYNIDDFFLCVFQFVLNLLGKTFFDHKLEWMHWITVAIILIE